MGLFDMFKSKSASDLNDFSCELLNISNKIIKEKNIDVKKITDMEMHVASFYIFGFATSLRTDKYKTITPTQMSKAMTDIISKLFLCSTIYANDLIEDGIRSLQLKEYDDVKRAIIHKGMDAYLLWKNKKINLFEDLIKILIIIQGNK